MVDGEKLYLMDDLESLTPAKKEAALFPSSAFDAWGEYTGLEREDLGEDEYLRLIKSPILPGFDFYFNPV